MFRVRTQAEFETAIQQVVRSDEPGGEIWFQPGDYYLDRLTIAGQATAIVFRGLGASSNDVCLHMTITVQGQGSLRLQNLTLASQQHAAPVLNVVDGGHLIAEVVTLKQNSTVPMMQVKQATARLDHFSVDSNVKLAELIQVTEGAQVRLFEGQLPGLLLNNHVNLKMDKLVLTGPLVMKNDSHLTGRKLEFWDCAAVEQPLIALTELSQLKVWRLRLPPTDERVQVVRSQMSVSLLADNLKQAQFITDNDQQVRILRAKVNVLPADEIVLPPIQEKSMAEYSEVATASETPVREVIVNERSQMQVLTRLKQSVLADDFVRKPEL